MGVAGINTTRLVEAAQTLVRNQFIDEVGTGAQRVVRMATRPNEHLYPFVWDWDSALVANAFAEAGAPRRALAELATLHGAQHDSGLVAHIAFMNNADDLARYFPGPDAWGGLVGRDGRSISGISQPPISGIALRRAFEAGGEADTPIIRELVDRIHDHHRWWLRARNPAGDGNVEVLHGWATGRDNAPEVLALMRADDMPVRSGVQALRRDLSHGVDPASRPDEWYYARAVGLADAGVARGGWSDPTLAARMPFRLADPMVGALLAASSHDVGTVARRLGMTQVADEAAEISSKVSSALTARMLPDGTIPAIDMRTGAALVDHTTIAQPMVAWAPGMDEQALLRAARLVDDGGALAGEHGVLSAAQTDRFYDPQRYWLGATWPHMDELVARGLQRAADEPGRSPDVRAALLRAVDSLDARVSAAINRWGTPEYRHAETGETAGKVGMSFSSGAMLMHASRRGAPGLDDAMAAWRSLGGDVPADARIVLGDVFG